MEDCSGDWESILHSANATDKDFERFLWNVIICECPKKLARHGLLPPGYEGGKEVSHVERLLIETGIEKQATSHPECWIKWLVASEARKDVISSEKRAELRDRVGQLIDCECNARAHEGIVYLMEKLIDQKFPGGVKEKIERLKSLLDKEQKVKNDRFVGENE